MGFLGKMFGKKQSEVKASSITREQQPSGKANKAQNTAEDLIRALSYEDDKSAGATWSKRRDAAAKLGALGESAAVAPLYAGMNTAIDKMRQSHSKLNPKQLDCLLNWKLTVLPETHTEAEYDSLPERTGTALTIIYIGEFEWARATAIVHAEALAKLGEEKAAQQLVSELQKLQGAQPEQAEALLHPASTNKSSTEPSTPVKEEPAKRAWTPTIPRYASHMPLSDLQHIFIFTDGNGQAVLDSPVVIGMLQDTAEAPLKDFMGKVQFDIIARSNVASQIQQTGKIPESAWTAMSNIDSAITQKARVGTYRSVVRVSEDPRTKEQFVLVLIYRM